MVEPRVGLGGGLSSAQIQVRLSYGTLRGGFLILLRPPPPPPPSLLLHLAPSVALLLFAQSSHSRTSGGGGRRGRGGRRTSDPFLDREKALFLRSLAFLLVGEVEQLLVSLVSKFR